MIKALIDVGGHRLSARIAGKGMPVVVFEAHFGGTKQAWKRVWRQVASFTTVVVYDRAGLGESDPGPFPRTTFRIVEDLRRLLDRSGIRPPFVLVGHSFGGLYVQAFARRHPTLVVGMVLVDSAHEDAERAFWPIMSQANRQRALEFRRSNPEGVDISRSLVQARRAGVFPDVPLIVLSAPIRIGTIIAPGEVWTREQRALDVRLSVELASRSRLGKLLAVPGASHFIQSDRPHVVIASIRKVVKQVRGISSAATRPLSSKRRR